MYKVCEASIEFVSLLKFVRQETSVEVCGSFKELVKHESSEEFVRQESVKFMRHL